MSANTSPWSSSLFTAIMCIHLHAHELHCTEICTLHTKKVYWLQWWYLL